MMAGRVVDELEGRRAAAMKPGDYAVQVHVIECRDLKAEDAAAFPDELVSYLAGHIETTCAPRRNDHVPAYTDLDRQALA